VDIISLFFKDRFCMRLFNFCSFGSMGVFFVVYLLIL
jgi:hypothetical protein